MKNIIIRMQGDLRNDLKKLHTFQRYCLLLCQNYGKVWNEECTLECLPKVLGNSKFLEPCLSLGG